MNTEFEIFCVHADSDYAQQAALAAFDLLDRMEHELSRFIPNSDISRINHLADGESLRVSQWTMECLQLARQAYDETGGAFDISLGTGLERIELGANLTVTRTGAPPDVRLDLGGIGKGYAVDRMAEALDEWDIRQALIHGGHSSVLALDPPPGVDGWPLVMGNRAMQARRRAFSASGVREQGDHIVDPRIGQPARTRVAAWVSLEAEGSSSPGAVAEAFSTAFLILPDAQIEAIRARHPGMDAWFLESDAIHVTNGGRSYA
ncbi:MAG: FAD:protein FMN transferase [Ignavibacteriota bacterium]